MTGVGIELSQTLVWTAKKSEHFSESINISKKKSLKFVTFYSLKNSPNLVKNHLPKKVKILVNQQKFL